MSSNSDKILKSKKQLKPLIYATSNSSKTGLLYIILVLSISSLVEWKLYYELPTKSKLNIRDSEVSSVISEESFFNVHNARKYLLELTDIGPRVTGSYENEVATPKLLVKIVNDIKVNCFSSSRYNGMEIEVEEQHPSGNFYLPFLNGMTNVYTNVTNVIVRLSWPKHIKSSQPSILINAHFDSFPGSPGASDDGIGVACMLEAIRTFSVGKPLSSPILLLFNGGEESMHIAAHGFMKYHRWAQSVKYLINLEAIGSGGKELVFQCNSGWLASLYGKVSPHPHMSVIAHELFLHVLWRAASTDYVTIIKYGPPGIKAIDTAYIENGYVYHTKFDVTNVIPNGTFVNTGENIISITKALAEITPPSSDPADERADKHAVFFDFLGYYVITYQGWNLERQ
eukprot:gene15931-21612_t